MDERAQFEEFVAHNVARLADVARQWTSRLSQRDADWLLERALHIAWQTHRKFDPRRTSIVLWFADCMQKAANGRKVWRVWTTVGPEWVLAKHLRRLP